MIESAASSGTTATSTPNTAQLPSLPTLGHAPACAASACPAWTGSGQGTATRERAGKCPQSQGAPDLAGAQRTDDPLSSPSDTWTEHHCLHMAVASVTSRRMAPMDIQSPAPSPGSSVPSQRGRQQPQEDGHTAQLSSLPRGDYVHVSSWERPWPMTSLEPVLFSTGQNYVREPTERCGRLQARAQAKGLLREA